MHNRDVPDEVFTREAIALAARLVQQAQHDMTRQEKRQAAKIASMLTDPHGKTLTMALVDQAFRSHTPARIADHPLLRRPDVEYISVKISSIFSQINLVAFDHTVAAIQDRLRALYRQAMQYKYVWPDGQSRPKFVNLAMEEYRDLHLTVAAFTQVLDEPAFLPHRAGIVLQAYLPDSATVQRELTTWALRRIERRRRSLPSHSRSVGSCSIPTGQISFCYSRTAKMTSSV